MLGGFDRNDEMLGADLLDFLIVPQVGGHLGIRPVRNAAVFQHVIEDGFSPFSRSSPLHAEIQHGRYGALALGVLPRHLFVF